MPSASHDFLYLFHAGQESCRRLDSGGKRGSKNSSLTGRALTAAMSALIWSSDPVKIHRSAPCGCG